MRKIMKITVVAFCCLSAFSRALAQEEEYNIPDEAIISEMGSNLWVGSYNVFRIGEKLFWDAQHHYRRGAYNGVPFVGKMDQIYNRHALSYVVNKTFRVTAGGVLRLDFPTDPEDESLARLRYEPRFWHEYLFIMPYNRFMVYHRIRVEHRWTKGFNEDADWDFKNRWRYKIYAFIPLNKPKLEPGAWYIVPDVEIIMQSGKSIVDNPLEDLRIYPQVGYIVSPRLKIGGGPMYTTGQRSGAGYEWRQRIVFRVNAYVSLNLRKFENKIPDINFSD